MPAETPTPRATEPVTVPVTHRLTDRTLDIQPFMERNADGSFKYTDVACLPMPGFDLKAVAADFIDWREKKLTAHDQQVIQQLTSEAHQKEIEKNNHAVKAGAIWDTSDSCWKYPAGVVPHTRGRSKSVPVSHGQPAGPKEPARIREGDIDFFSGW